MQCGKIIEQFSSTTPSSSYNSFYSQVSRSYNQEFAIIQCFWHRSDLTALEFVMYAYVVPTFSIFGLCTNFISFVIFTRPKMTPSAFSYLATLSGLDCASCLLITITSFSRSILQESTLWVSYDFQWQTPLLGITMGAANLILGCVSLDRLIYLTCGVPNGTPKFCRRTVARSVIIAVILFAILINMPYFWVFVVNDDGTFEATEFYFGKYYLIHNWLTFTLLTLLPALFLIIGNVAILMVFCKWAQQSNKCQSTCPQPNNKNGQGRYKVKKMYTIVYNMPHFQQNLLLPFAVKRQMKLTITIVVIITLYLVGDLPADLTSRKCIVGLLYAGDVTKVDLQNMQRMEIISITLNAIHLSINIIVYALINPCFVRELQNCLKEASNVYLRLVGTSPITARCWQKCSNSVAREKQYQVSDCANNTHYNSTAKGLRQVVTDRVNETTQHKMSFVRAISPELKIVVIYDNKDFE